MLCLPTWKSLTGPPHKTPNQPPGLSHFTCYVVTSTNPPYNPPPLLLQDQFAPRPVQAQVSNTASWLCLPSQKTGGTHVYKIVNATTHLLCFQVSPTPTKSPVYDQNQFGTGKVTWDRRACYACRPPKLIG